MIALAAWLALGSALSAADESGDELVQMIVNLVSDKDKTCGPWDFSRSARRPRARRPRSGSPPCCRNCRPRPRPALLDALADRGDNAARPAVLEMLKSREEAVRAAAIRALGSLGKAADVPLLVRALAAAEAGKAAAQASLVQLPGRRSTRPSSPN